MPFPVGPKALFTKSNSEGVGGKNLRTIRGGGGYGYFLEPHNRCCISVGWCIVTRWISGRNAAADSDAGFLSNLICWIEFNIAEMWHITQALSKSICPVTFCCWRNKLGGLSVLLTTYSVNRACSIFFVDRIWWCLYVLHFVLIDRTHYHKLPQETCGSKSMELQSFLKQLIFISYYAEMTLSWF